MKIWKDWDFVFMHGLAAFWVWGSLRADERGVLYYLFAATVLLIVAYGRRIFNAIESQNTIKDETKDVSKNA